MIRNSKALGLSLVAIFAMTGLSASAASATDFFTTATGGTAILTAVGHNHALTLGGSKFECTTAKFAATLTSGASEVTVDAEYSGKIGQTPHNSDGSSAAECSATGGDVTVDMNGCAYILTGNTTGSDNGTDATVWIECPVGQVIKITQLGTGATISLPPQTPTTGGVTHTNDANHPGGTSVKVKATATGITYHCTGFACHFGSGTSGQNGTYTGEATATGYADLDGLPTPVSEGSRVGVSVS